MWISCTKTWCSGLTKEIVISCIINAVKLCLGLCRGYSSFLIIQLQADDSPMHLTVEEESWIATFGIIPNPLGSLLAGALMDMIGRKYTTMLLYPIFLSGWFVVSIATNVYMLYLGMFINGIGVGMSSCNSMYVAEIGTPHYRGFLLAFTTVMFTFGVLLCNILLYGIAWRMSALLFCICCLILFCACALLPESPSWLISRGRYEEAAEVLNWLRDNAEDAKRERDDLKNYVESTTEQKKSTDRNGSAMETVRTILSCWRQVALVSVLWIVQQSTGYVPSITYTASIFKCLNIPIDVPLASLAYIVVLFLSTLGSLPIHYHFRRRPVLLWGTVCCFLCYTTAAIYQTMFYNSSSEKPYFWILLAAVYVGLVCTIFSLVTVPFIMCGEVLPSENRGILMGVSGAIGYAYFAVLVKMYLVCLHAFGITYIFWTYSICCIFVGLFAYFVLPETKDKTLNQIQQQYFQKPVDKVDGMSSCNSMYVAEIGTPHYRGFLLAFTTVMFTFGVLLCNILLYGIAWRMSALLFCICCLILFCACALLPESPSWLISRGRYEEAAEVLNWLRDNAEDAKRERDDLKNYVESTTEQKKSTDRNGSAMETVRTILSCWRQVALVSVLWIVQQSTGYVPSITYTASIFKCLNIPIDVPLASLAYIVVLFLSTLGSLPIHYHFRRRPVLLWGTVCCFLCYTTAAIYQTMFYNSSSEKPYFWILLAAVYVGLVCTIFSLVTVPFIMCGEVLPSENRGILMGVSGAIGYAYFAVLVKMYLVCLHAFGITYIFWTYSICCIFVGLFAYFVLPETKDKTLNQIQQQYFQKPVDKVDGILTLTA